MSHMCANYESRRVVVQDFFWVHWILDTCDGDDEIPLENAHTEAPDVDCSRKFP